MVKKTQPPQNSQRVFELDALRGFAALFVVAFHFSLGFSTSRFFKYGVTGVDLFFMISGFVILLTVEKTASAKEFILNRLSRLYPTYWVCVTLTTCLLLLHGDLKFPKVAWQYLANMTMMQQLLRQPDIDGPYWTMIIELFFYLYIIMLLLLRQIKRIEAISLFFLILNFVYALLPWVNNHYAYYCFGMAYRFPIINHFPLFFAGIIFYNIRLQGATNFRYLLLLLCFICQATLFDKGGRSHFYIAFIPYLILLAGHFLTFQLFVLGKLKFLVGKGTLFLGGLSFAIYLIHQAISLQIVIPFLTRFTNWWVASGGAFIIVLAVALCINKYIEIPAMVYLRTKYKTTHKGRAYNPSDYHN